MVKFPNIAMLHGSVYHTFDDDRTGLYFLFFLPACLSQFPFLVLLSWPHPFRAAALYLLVLSCHFLLLLRLICVCPLFGRFLHWPNFLVTGTLLEHSRAGPPPTPAVPMAVLRPRPASHL